MARNAKNTRMCAACRTKLDKSELMHICRQKNGSVLLLGFGKSGEGRGMYLCPNLKCIETAEKKNVFCRNLRGEVPAGFTDELKRFVKSLNME